MGESIGKRIAHMWNAFQNKHPTEQMMYYGSTSRPDRVSTRLNNTKSIINPIFNRIALDVSSLKIHHVRLNDDGQFKEIINSSLEKRFNVSANIDQTGRSLIQEIVHSLCDEGEVAVVPVETSINPAKSTSYEIHSLRVGKIVEWFPRHIKVRLYNDEIGMFEEITVPKSSTAIIENPLYAIMNEQNSILKRLIDKLNLLDMTDNNNNSGNLDIIIKLPYVIKTPAKRAQAERRLKNIQDQLTNSKYGIAYTDGAEKITQLNRPAENNLFKQVEYLTRMLYSQLGLTETVFDGTADEATMLNYYNRSIEPYISVLVDEFKRKFLTETARTQKQSIMYFRNYFALVPISDLADIADKFTRNAILSSNEMRGIIGFKPSDDPKADELSNKNINQSAEKVEETEDTEGDQNES